jgi:hypothetical protein
MDILPAVILWLLAIAAGATVATLCYSNRSSG